MYELPTYGQTLDTQRAIRFWSCRGWGVLPAMDPLLNVGLASENTGRYQYQSALARYTKQGRFAARQ